MTEKIFCILYKYDFCKDKLIFIKGFKFDVDDKDKNFIDIIPR